MRKQFHCRDISCQCVCLARRFSCAGLFPLEQAFEFRSQFSESFAKNNILLIIVNSWTKLCV